MKVKDRLMRSVEELITKDRDGEQIVTSQVSGLVQCLSMSCLYSVRGCLELHR
jgi:hypothetical protein